MKIWPDVYMENSKEDIHPIAAIKLTFYISKKCISCHIWPIAQLQVYIQDFWAYFVSLITFYVLMVFNVKAFYYYYRLFEHCSNVGVEFRLLFTFNIEQQ